MPSTVAKHLCRRCSTLNWIDLNTGLGFQHHESWTDLLASAASGCQLCAFVEKHQHFCSPTPGKTGVMRVQGPPNEIPSTDDNQIYVTMSASDTEHSFERERYIEDMCLQKKSNTSQEHNKAKQGVWLCAFIQPNREEVYLALSLEIFIGTDSLLTDTQLFGARTISDHASNDDVLCLAQEWFQHCSQNHIYCRSSKPKVLPARTLDVGSQDGSQEPFLHVNKTGETGQWIALSHCWGDEKTGSFCRTLVSNLAQHRQCIPLDTLPPTFRDAVTVTRKLGYQFLWIDSLCIVQNDASDWEMESKKMVDIYQNAALVLAAETAKNAQGGLLKERKASRSGRDIDTITIPFYPFNAPQHILHELWKVGIGQEVHLRCGASLSPEGHLETRAWALQERALASRVLHYNIDRLHWSCESQTLREGILIDTDGKPQMYRSRTARLGIPGFCDYWYFLVGDYLDRNLTRESDKFAAITGLAKRTAELTDYTYTAGLWLEDMHKGLLWSSRENGRQSTTDSAPSWTWMSLRNGDPEAKIYNGLFHPEKRDESYDLVIHECRVYHIDDEDIWSTCTGGYLIVTGYWRTADPWPSSSLPHINQDPTRDKRKSFLMESYYTEDDENYPLPDQVLLEFDLPLDCEPVNYMKAPVCYLQVAKWWAFEEGGDSSVFALILEPTGENEGEYRRVGRAEIPQFNRMAQDGWIKKTVMII